MLAVLVQAGGQADQLRKLQAKAGIEQWRWRFCQQVHGAAAAGGLDGAQAEAMGAFGIEGEQEGAGEEYIQFKRPAKKARVW